MESKRRGRILLDFFISLILRFFKTTSVENRREHPHAMSEDAASSFLVHSHVSGYGPGGHFSNPSEKNCTGPGSPAPGIDGQLQFHHPHPGALEGR
jgi:hypothetical protein